MYECVIERHSRDVRAGTEVVSFLITFPRIVLAETVTHRTNSDIWGDWDVYFTERTTTPDVSKNSASSRAVPFERMLRKTTDDPFVPFWTLDQKGMQGRDVTDPEFIRRADAAWKYALADVTRHARYLHGLGVHKQQINRLLEPFVWVTQLLTADRVSLQNFFALRCHRDADPHFRKIARMMFLTLRKSVPTELEYGQWHLPFVCPKEQQKFFWQPISGSDDCDKRFELPDLIKFSAARCGWLSYANHDRDGSEGALLRTYARFVESPPVHASPLEAQLTPLPYYFPERYRSNVRGWLQARKLLADERTLSFDPDDEEIASWGEGV